MTLPPDARASKPSWYEVLIAAVLATSLYIYLFGADTLAPTHYTWLLQGDPAQHYLGWQFFRHEAWQWPLGRIQSFGYPSGTAIVFTDSIPLLALFFKPFSQLLPAEFQYFGAWMLACYVLNGYFGLRLIARHTCHSGLRIAAASFFILSPPLLLRGYGHEALMAHWLVLASLDTCLRGWCYRRWLLWSSIAALVHPYLLVMVLGLLAASFATTVCVDKNPPLRLVLLQCAGIGLVLLSLMGLAGYFSSMGSLQADGYGYYNMNILSLVDPLLDWSRYIRQRPIHPEYAALGNFGQYEGFLYLGAGMILLFIMALGLFLMRPQQLARRFWPVFAVALIFWLLALSNVVTFGDQTLFTLQIPQALHQTLSVFRASGRFGWPAFYLVNLVVLVLIIRNLPARSALAVLLAALLLQVADQSDKYVEFKGLIRQRMAWQTPLQSPQWAAMAQKANALVMIPPLPDIAKTYIPFAHLAVAHRLVTNAAQIARDDLKRTEALGQAMAESLAQGAYNPLTLYVFSRREGLANLPPDLAGQVLALDGYFVLPPGLPRLK